MELHAAARLGGRLQNPVECQDGNRRGISVFKPDRLTAQYNLN